MPKELMGSVSGQQRGLLGPDRRVGTCWARGVGATRPLGPGKARGNLVGVGSWCYPTIGPWQGAWGFSGREDLVAPREPRLTERLAQDHAQGIGG